MKVKQVVDRIIKGIFTRDRVTFGKIVDSRVSHLVYLRQKVDYECSKLTEAVRSETPIRYRKQEP